MATSTTNNEYRRGYDDYPQWNPPKNGCSSAFADYNAGHEEAEIDSDYDHTLDNKERN